MVMSPAFKQNVMSINIFWKNESSLTSQTIDLVEKLFKPNIAGVNFAKIFNLNQQDLNHIYGFRLQIFMNTKRSVDPEGIFDNDFSERLFPSQVQAFHDL